MASRRAYALHLGGKFMLLNVARMHVRKHDPVSKPPPSMREMFRSDVWERLSLKDPYQDEEVPDYVSKKPEDLTEEEKYAIRQQFYAYCNMPSSVLSRWLKDPRIADGCGNKPFDVLRTTKRLHALAFIKVSADRYGRNWNSYYYKVAQECVFVFQNLFQPRTVDYVNWALLRNFGLDWARPTKNQPVRSLPTRVKLAAQLALVRYQISGRPKW